MFWFFVNIFLCCKFLIKLNLNLKFLKKKFFENKKEWKTKMLNKKDDEIMHLLQNIKNQIFVIFLE